MNKYDSIHKKAKLICDDEYQESSYLWVLTRKECWKSTYLSERWLSRWYIQKIHWVVNVRFVYRKYFNVKYILYWHQVRPELKKDQDIKTAKQETWSTWKGTESPNHCALEGAERGKRKEGAPPGAYPSQWICTSCSLSLSPSLSLFLPISFLFLAFSPLSLLPTIERKGRNGALDFGFRKFWSIILYGFAWRVRIHSEWMPYLTLG